MLYHLYEMQRAAMMPMRLAAEATRNLFRHPLNPMAHIEQGRMAAAAADIFEQVTRRYGKPDFNITRVSCDGVEVDVHEETVVQRSFCRLLHFRRETDRNDPKLLIVAPLSGHYATLLRGTVQTMLEAHDVYVTDWRDARMVPLHDGNFTLNDFVDYIIDFLHFLGPNTHVIAVCQPAVPVLAGVSVMSSWGDPCVPATMTLMGGPIDTRESPTAVNQLAKEHPIEWFEENAIVLVPPIYPGAGRRVYPGFLQLTNFLSMNLDRHIEAHHELFDHLVKGDEDSADRKRAFYEEYSAVLDLTADFYLQTVKVVFQEHALPQGEMQVRWQPVLPECITRTAIFCVEGELDDISGIGQTKAALSMTPNLPDEMKDYMLQEGAGHYGVFNGSRWRNFIAPRIAEFIRRYDHETGTYKLPRISGWRGHDRRAGRREGNAADRRPPPTESTASAS